jgi:pimeloyl-ACP methyl ester carboxylesterase
MMLNPTNLSQFEVDAPLDPIVLVHGAWHSPAVWDPVADLLEQRGHQVSVPKLPIDDVNASGADHADLIASVCADLDNPVIVCHTTGSLTSLLVPERTPVKQIIHVNGLLPKIGSSFSEQSSDDEFSFGEDSGRMYDRDARSFWVDEARFGERLAQDCDELTQAKLWNQLRPQARRSLTEVSPLIAWPSTQTAAIIYNNDADLPIAWLRRTALERLGVEAVELPGSQLGFNARPRLFVKTLMKLLFRSIRRDTVVLRRAS